MQQHNWSCQARRDHLQILIDVLEICETPNPKTQILHEVNTNFKLLQSYLLQLKAAQLIEKSPLTNKYSTSRKGLKFIKDWKALQKMMEPQQTSSTVEIKKYVVNHKQVLVLANSHQPSRKRPDSKTSPHLKV